VRRCSWPLPRRTGSSRIPSAASTTVRCAQLVAEPVAAAHFFVDVAGHRLPDGASALVNDLGAGTFDAAIVAHLRATVTAEEAWTKLLAGADPATRRARQQLWDNVRSAKEVLSRLSTTLVHLPLVDVDVPLGREVLDRLAAPVLDRTMVATQELVARTGDRPVAVFLAGGASRMPGVASALHRASHSPSPSPSPGIDPCLLGTWEQQDGQSITYIDNRQVQYIGARGTVRTFRPDGTSLINYDRSTRTYTNDMGVRWEQERRGTIEARYMADGKTVRWTGVRAIGTNTIYRNGRFHERQPLVAREEPDDYTCTTDRLSWTSSQKTYSSEWTRVTTSAPAEPAPGSTGGSPRRLVGTGPAAGGDQPLAGIPYAGDGQIVPDGTGESAPERVHERSLALAAAAAVEFPHVGPQRERFGEVGSPGEAADLAGRQRDPFGGQEVLECEGLAGGHTRPRRRFGRGSTDQVRRDQPIIEVNMVDAERRREERREQRRERFVDIRGDQLGGNPVTVVGDPGRHGPRVRQVPGRVDVEQRGVLGAGAAEPQQQLVRLSLTDEQQCHGVPGQHAAVTSDAHAAHRNRAEQPT
jgi:hypothetical protein